MTVTEEPIEGAKSSDVTCRLQQPRQPLFQPLPRAGVRVARLARIRDHGELFRRGLPGLSPDSSGSRYNAAAAGISIVTPWGLVRRNLLEHTIPDRPGARNAPGPARSTSRRSTARSFAYADESARLALTEWFTHTDQRRQCLRRFVHPHRSALQFPVRRREFQQVVRDFRRKCELPCRHDGRAGNFGPLRAHSRPPARGFPTPASPWSRATSATPNRCPTGTRRASHGTANGPTPRCRKTSNGCWAASATSLHGCRPSLVGDSGMLARATVFTPPWRWEGLA